MYYSNAASWPAKMALSLCVSRFFNTAYVTYYVTFHLIDLNNQYSI